MSPLEKARLVSQISSAALELASIGIRRRHPGASERELFLRLAAFKLGATLTRSIYPDAAQLPGLGA